MPAKNMSSSSRSHASCSARNAARYGQNALAITRNTFAPQAQIAKQLRQCELPGVTSEELDKVEMPKRVLDTFHTFLQEPLPLLSSGGGESSTILFFLFTYNSIIVKGT